MSLNPYFIRLPILISPHLEQEFNINTEGFNPYFIGLPILMIPNGFLHTKENSFNPYFIGLPILIASKVTR